MCVYIYVYTYIYIYSYVILFFKCIIIIIHHHPSKLCPNILYDQRVPRNICWSSTWRVKAGEAEEIYTRGLRGLMDPTKHGGKSQELWERHGKIMGNDPV